MEERSLVVPRQVVICQSGCDELRGARPLTAWRPRLWWVLMAVCGAACYAALARVRREVESHGTSGTRALGSAASPPSVPTAVDLQDVAMLTEQQAATWQCHEWSQQEEQELQESNPIWKQRKICQAPRHDGFRYVWTLGHNQHQPGCGTCWCCKQRLAEKDPTTAIPPATTTTPAPTVTASAAATLTSTMPTSSVSREPSTIADALKLERKWAFVMMAYDAHGETQDSMWGALAIARALHQFSQYPLLLLTNDTHFPDGTSVKEAFGKLSTKILPVHRVDMRGGKGWTLERWTFAFWKLQIWRLTDYEKLIWLDSDALVYRSLDWLFDREWMWAQRDAWFCDLDATHVCSGIMLMYPNEADFHGLLAYAEEVGEKLTSGDQQLIEWYFQDIMKKPVNLLSPLEASFGQCAGTAISPYLTKEMKPVPGIWSVPAFVHKSGGWDNTVVNAYNNVCFIHDVARQRYYIGDKVINVCHFNPLAAFWRKQFCAAAHDTGVIRESKVKEFCDDQCYFLGERSADPRCPSSGAIINGPLSAELRPELSPHSELAASPQNLPAPEQLKALAAYSFNWGRSWGDDRSIVFHKAALPKAPFTIVFNLRSMAPSKCQEVIGWFGSESSVELRLVFGDLMYGEAVSGKWSSVSTEAADFADGKSHHIAILRYASGKVKILHNGKVMASGSVQAEQPQGLSTEPRSSRQKDCSLNGEVQGLSFFTSVLTPEQMAEIA
eukprot:CAMPEP_0115430182 /NCGR_PEP_ID=MMETSP0271-20121206/30914_1 /TAXON_ID=71861 /ORGANISM="Scrippsiella trochoidea, Strain CCMP3099" /LENGTH=724 /DNA_ID=CAMNT_0002855405 /DNA_START=1 /DNA_END=2175 /DNA_ORIENTATION=+